MFCKIAGYQHSDTARRKHKLFVHCCCVILFNLLFCRFMLWRHKTSWFCFEKQRALIYKLWSVLLACTVVLN